MQKWFSEVFWSESGCGEFLLGKQRIRLKGCEIFYLLPGEIHNIRAVSREWTYHWFTLDHEISAKLLEAFGFVERPLPAKACPVTLFRQMQGAVQMGTPQGNREAAHYAHEILLLASQGREELSKSRHSLSERSKDLIDQHFHDPHFNVTQIAGMMNVHRATLFRTFLRSYDMTPSQYLQTRRLHRAIELLKQDDIPIKEVAMNSGMTDANYLSRQIRRMLGLSPREFRDSYRSGERNIYG